MTNRWYSIAAAFLLAKTMEQELVDATTAELWLNAFDAATALEPLVDPALVDMLAPHHPTFESHGAEIRWLRAEKFFLEHGRLAVAAVVRKAAEERAAAKAAQAAEKAEMVVAAAEAKKAAAAAAAEATSVERAKKVEKVEKVEKAEKLARGAAESASTSWWRTQQATTAAELGSAQRGRDEGRTRQTLEERGERREKRGEKRGEGREGREEREER